MRSFFIPAMLMSSVQCAVAGAVLVHADPEAGSVATVMQIELHFSEALLAVWFDLGR